MLWGDDHLATPITAHVVWKFYSVFKDVARVVGVTEAEILCGDWADPQWCMLPILLDQGNQRRDHFLFLLPLQS